MEAAESDAAENKKEVSVDGAKAIFREAIDGNVITPVEYATIDYIKATYKFEAAAEVRTRPSEVRQPFGERNTIIGQRGRSARPLERACC